MTYQEMVVEDYKRRAKVARKNKRSIGRLHIAHDAKVTMGFIIAQAGYTWRTIKAVRWYREERPQEFRKAYNKRQARRRMQKMSRRRNRAA